MASASTPTFVHLDSGPDQSLVSPRCRRLLSDEPMQQEYFGEPLRPVLEDARVLYEWVLGGMLDDDRVVALGQGPKMRVVGRAPSVP
jgi:hypothetical protein